MVIDLLELSNINVNIDTLVFNSLSQEQALLKEDKNFNKIIEEELIQRLKHQKLSQEQLVYLKQQIEAFCLSIKEISCKYFIWSSTLRKIKSMSLSDLKIIPVRKLNQINYSKSLSLKQQIMNYYNQSQCEFTSKDVEKYLIDLNSEAPPLNTIVKIMKEDWNLT